MAYKSGSDVALDKTNMTTEGSQSWQWTRTRYKKKERALGWFVPGSARTKVGPRSNFAYKNTRCAYVRRHERYNMAQARRIIASQLIRAKVRKPCPTRKLLMPKKRKLMTSESALIHFVKCGPKPRNRAASGHFLCFADKEQRFIAVDCSKVLHKPRELRYIEVVRVKDCWS